MPESIPNEDKLSRACFELPPGVDAASGFLFKYRDAIGDRPESVYWRKYAVSDADVHRRGCELERLRQSRAAPGKSPGPYVGFRTAKAGAVRAVAEAGYELQVIHSPENGDDAHAHICVRKDNLPVTNSIPRSVLRVLIHLLFAKFAEFKSHSCPQ